MYCKVCFDAGKPEEVFTSHTVKNQFGMVTCVTLLEHHCESCGCIGHTPKYCPAPKPVKKFCAFCRDNGKMHTDHNMWETDLSFERNCFARNVSIVERWATHQNTAPSRQSFVQSAEMPEEITITILPLDDVVVCEYLLGLECSNCGELGHTRKYCTQPPPKFCPVCKDAGNDHDHDLMKDGVVVCEFLLGLECGNCGELGHTPKYCTRPRRKSTVQKLQEGNNLAIRLENALSQVPIESKNKGKKKYRRVL